MDSIVTIDPKNPRQGTRLGVALGKYLNTQDFTDPNNPVPRDATKEEVEMAGTVFYKNIVDNTEREVLEGAVVVDDFEAS